MAAFEDLARLVTFRPLSTPLPAADYPGTFSSPFSAKWSQTVGLLVREVKHLRPRQAVLELDLREQEFRLDGLPRANARAASPGVVLSLLGTPHGDLRYPSHHFHSWDDNVRALALALEALRKVDRYKVTRRGEQYAGWKALPRGDDDGSPERGADLVRRHGGVKAALMATHPDHESGNARDFRDVQAYRDAA